MIKFTKEEISLCKQIAEKQFPPKLFRWGDWYYFDKKVHLIISKPEPIMSDCCIPLWTISDCLEFLEERKILDWSIDKDLDEDGKLTGNTCFWWEPRLKKFEDNHTLGKTPLEACLKAVLAVVEEVKK